jgi:hypothetical protein
MSLLAVVPILFVIKAHWLAIVVTVIATIALTVMLQKLDPLQFPRGCDTLGDLARLVAARSAAAMARQGARLDEQTVWRALVALAERYSLSKANIDRTTTILRAVETRRN